MPKKVNIKKKLFRSYFLCKLPLKKELQRSSLQRVEKHYSFIFWHAGRLSKMAPNSSNRSRRRTWVAKALKLESARKGDFSMLFGSLSPIGASLMSFASPKIIPKTAPLRVTEFWNKRFFDWQGTKRSKSWRICEYFNKATAKNMCSKIRFEFQCFGYGRERFGG